MDVKNDEQKNDGLNSKPLTVGVEVGVQKSKPESSSIKAAKPTKNTLYKSVSVEPSILEKEQNKQQSILEEPRAIGNVVNKRDNNSIKDGKNVWTRKQYNNRRKSTDFSNISEQRRVNNKPRYTSENQSVGFHQQQQQPQQKSFNDQRQQQQQESGKTSSVSPNANAKDRHKAYNRTNNQKNFSTNSEKSTIDNKKVSVGGQKNRSTSRSQEKDEAGEVVKGHRRSTNSNNGKASRITSNSMNSNGESFEYDDLELEEPFSDSDDENARIPVKPSLAIPRGRIRTLSGTVPPVGYSPKWGGPTMCLSCLQFFNLPEQIGSFAIHLLEIHHIVVEEVDLIVDPKRYIEHWRQRFAKESVDKIFPKILPTKNDILYGKVDYYYEMSERIPEDFELRQRLAMRRLEEALACQQRERDEMNFSMQCIFCRYVARGNRAKIIHHLYMIHHLNLGSPDNLVFVHEYIAHLKEKLQRNECIYCEKTFSDRTVLMDHMRKRNHREVNPKNNYYDKFYIINYLELGKRWLDVLAEDFEDTTPTFVDSDDEEEQESWHEWQEDNMDVDQLRSVCLFCDFSSEKIEEMLEHFKNLHEFDLCEFIKEQKLDTYSRMKFLNFIRKQTYNTPGSRNSINSSPKPITIPERECWDIDESLVPMFGNDHLLWMLESYLEGKENPPEIENLKLRSFSRKSTSSVDDPEIVTKEIIENSKQNTIDGVVAEDWPDLTQSVFQIDQELYKSIR